MRVNHELSEGARNMRDVLDVVCTANASDELRRFSVSRVGSVVLGRLLTAGMDRSHFARARVFSIAQAFATTKERQDANDLPQAAS